MLKLTKKARSVMACLLAALLLPIFALPMMALGELPPETGNLVIHKLIGAEGAPGDGTELASLPAGAIPAAGIKFDLYKVDTGAGIPASGMTYKLSGANPNLMEVFDGDSTLVDTYPVAAASPASVITGAGDGIATAAGLSQGLYLVIEDLAGSTPTNALTGEKLTIDAACAPFLVAVPMSNITGDGWLETVHVYPKNEALSIEKEVDISEQDAVAVGDQVTYTITASVPGDILTSKKFSIIDDLDEALDLDESSIIVSAEPGGKLLTEDTSSGGDYTVTYDGKGRRLVIEFTASGRADLDGFSSVKVSFATTVNANILNKVDGTVGNEASVEFTNESDTDYEANTGGGGPEIHTAAIQITKLDESNQALIGAMFKIASSEQNAKDNKFLRIDGDGVIYDVNDPGYDTLSAKADYEIAPANVTSFTGLKDSIDGNYQSYWIVETKAPAGYNILSEAVQVTFDGSEGAYTYLLTVNNHKGFVLPKTGGMGAIALTVAGIVLLGTAVIVGMSKKKTAVTS